MMTHDKVRCRLDGILEGVHGPLFPVPVDRTGIAQTMGWEDGGQAEPVITRTMDLLRRGKSVKLTSHFGVCYFHPLADEEDGTRIPRSVAEVHDGEGRLIERAVSGTEAAHA